MNMDSPGTAHGSIQVERAASPTPEMRALIEELDHELSQNYEPHNRHGLSLDAIFRPHIRFFIARLDGSPAGCGGIALFSTFAEVKRMYIRPAARGRGVADAILTALAAEVSGAGLTLLRLETGIHQLAALRFDQRCGFVPCAAFEPYASMSPHAIATSVFLEKRLPAT